MITTAEEESSVGMPINWYPAADAPNGQGDVFNRVPVTITLSQIPQGMNGGRAGYSLVITTSATPQGLFFWKAATGYDPIALALLDTEDENPEGARGWIMSLAEVQGDQVTIYAGADTDVQGDGTFTFAIARNPDPATHGTSYQRIHIDRIKYSIEHFGLEVDSNNDGTIDAADDEVEQAQDHVLPVGIEHVLRVRGYRHYSSLQSPSATIGAYPGGRTGVRTGSSVRLPLGPPWPGGTSYTWTEPTDIEVSTDAATPYVLEGRLENTDDEGVVVVLLSLNAGLKVVAYDACGIVVVGGNLQIHNGLDGTGGDGGIEIADGDDEEDVGAVTVANLNDTDGDGTEDKGDTDVSVSGSNPPGRNEIDLMKLLVYPLSGYTETADRVRVRVAGGGAAIWKDGPSGKPQSKANGAAEDWYALEEIPSEGLVLWVEATAASNAARDIEIVYEARFLEGGDPAWVVVDRVKATGVWATLAETWHVRGPGTDELPSSQRLDYQDLRDYIELVGAIDLSLYGAPTFRAQGGVDIYIGGRILLEFRVAPPDAAALGCFFDVTRQRRATNSIISSGSGTIIENPELSNSQYPEHDEQPNDDGNDEDEDNVPSTAAGSNQGFVYSFDHPATLRAVDADEAFNMRRFEAKEWVRMRIGAAVDHAAGAGNTVQGSRASGKTTWHWLGYCVRASVAGYGLDSDETSASYPLRSGAGNGYAEVSVLGSAVTEGFTATYDAGSNEFTLEGTLSSPVSIGQVGGTWTLTIPERVTAVITPGTTAFATGDAFRFSVFKTTADGGKQNQIGLDVIDVEDGP